MGAGGSRRANSEYPSEYEPSLNAVPKSGLISGSAKNCEARRLPPSLGVRGTSQVEKHYSTIRSEIAPEAARRDALLRA